MNTLRWWWGRAARAEREVARLRAQLEEARQVERALRLQLRVLRATRTEPLYPWAQPIPGPRLPFYDLIQQRGNRHGRRPRAT